MAAMSGEPAPGPPVAPLFAMADLEQNARRQAAGKKEIPLSPIAIEIVRRIDAVTADDATASDTLFDVTPLANSRHGDYKLPDRRILEKSKPVAAGSAEANERIRGASAGASARPG